LEEKYWIRIYAWRISLVSAGKGLQWPAILSANALLDGNVVYRSAGGWSPRLGDAVIADDGEALARLEAIAAAAAGGNEVVGPELVPIGRDGAGRIVPRHVRERIRALGPTVRPDLGPQAQAEHFHVSL
jgi:hypothetical protein